MKRFRRRVDVGNRRTRSFWIGMLRTTPFIMAGILSLVLFYSQSGVTFDWNRDTIIGLIFVFLVTTVYFTVSQQLPYSKRNIIEDLLDATLYQLGEKYRINIMRFITEDGLDGFAYFKIAYGRGYRDTSKYKQKITMNIPGASDALSKNEPFYYPQKDLRSDIDPDLKHLWSVPVKGRRGYPLAVLNIDNIMDDQITDETKEHILKAAQQLAELIGYYWEIPG